MMKNRLLTILLIFVIVLMVFGFYFFKSEIPIQQLTEQSYTEELKPIGWFKTGQDADIMLSGVDFNNAGGPLLFNHPKGLATDGKRLLLADTNNNRILIWNTLPEANQEPDLVLGQKNFITNNPGDGLDQLNWPVGVATDGKRVLVADTYNHRILIWNSFPTKNGQKADIVLQGSEKFGMDKRGNILWPWAVWTDGKKVIVASTGSGQVLIWNQFPTINNQPPDIVLKLPEFGTPRSIASNGKQLAITDHNAFGDRSATFFWRTFPTKDDQRYDFFITDPELIGRKEIKLPAEHRHGRMLWADFTEEGKFVALGDLIFIWNNFPQNENDPPDYIIGATSPMEPGYRYRSGDGSGVVTVGNRLYLTLSNNNKIVGFYSLPTQKTQKPDFAIGAPDIYTNTLEANYFITNPIPATNGKSLFVTSDFDNKLYIWKKLPDKSGAKPDIVYQGIGNAWDNALFGDIFAVAGGKKVMIWKKLPLGGESPDLIFEDSIGKIKFQEIRGITIDGQYFYLADHQANKVYVWEGIPQKTSNPKIILNISGPWRLSSDGKYLAVTVIFNHSIYIYRINELSQNSKPKVIRSAGSSTREGEKINFNLPEMALVYNGSLFIADTGFNRVLVWRDVEDAISGKRADAILGEESLQDTKPEIGKDKLFWPAGLAFDGKFLWVGEFKFSGRLLRFSVK
jgi:hypothetical protein